MLRTYLFLLFLFVFLAGCTQNAATPLPSPELTLKLDALFDQWNKTTPGGVLTIQKGNKIIYNKAFGMANLEYDILNTTNTIFETGSVAKQFTAAAIFLLALDGKLSLDDDVHRYIPELPDYGYKMTIRHLIHHTSGLRD
ncbi:MAG: serine hydrolase domain-containing protein, partial [Saprospiraceae bacterium]